MRAMKRTVSVLLSLMLVLGMMTIGMSAVSAAETNSIEVTSNLGAGGEAQYTENSEQVTVTFKLKTDVSIVNTQSVLTFDPTVLKIASTNTEATVMPNFSGAIVNLTKTDGRLPMNWANYQGTDAFNGTEAVYAVVVFDILKSGVDTTVNLEVSDLTGNTDPQGGVKNDVKIIETYEEINDTTRYTATVDEKVTPEEGGTGDISKFIYSRGVNLKGKIGFQYIFYANPEGYDASKLTIAIKGPHADQDVAEMPYSSMKSAGKMGGVSVRQQAYFLMASYLSQDITITIKESGKVVCEDAISVCDFVTDSIAKNPQDTVKNKLFCAMLNYGAQSQLFTKKYTDNLANKNIDPTIAPLAASDITIPAGVDSTHPDVSGLGLSLFQEGVELGSQNAVNIYYYVDDATKFASASATADGKALTFAPSGKMSGKQLVLMKIADIAAKDLDGVHTISFSNGKTYNVCIMKYLKNRLEKDANDDISKAMYWYCMAAKEYFAA